MTIVRAKSDSSLFAPAQLECGACCFYPEDQSNRFFFQISGRTATLFADNQLHIDEAVSEFLFYSGFITLVQDQSGNTLARRDVPLKMLEIVKIQPSQFYISESKLQNCKKWIKSAQDVMIPVASIGQQTVALDGHTRLRAALDMGLTHVPVYPDDCGDYISFFCAEAQKRAVKSVADMPVLSDSEYNLKWNKFCDDFFAGRAL